MKSPLVHNEQTKLMATYVNGIAVALMAVGVLAPIAGLVTTGTAPQPLQLGLLLIGCVIMSVALNYSARVILRGLDDD